MMDEKSISYLTACVKGKISTEIQKKMIRHINRYLLSGKVCAWYSNWDDFCSDWCSIGYTKAEAKKLLHGGIGEFQIIRDFGIIRYAI